MSTPTAPPAAKAAEDERSAGFFALAARELRKNRLAVLGLWAILGLFLLAVFAPVLAQNQPFLYRDDSGWSSPWLVALFDRLAFENAVDIFFNLLLVLSPFAVAGGWWLRRRLGPRLPDVMPRLAGRLVLGFLLLYVAVATTSVGSFENPLSYSRAVKNHRTLVEEEAKAGRKPEFRRSREGFRLWCCHRSARSSPPSFPRRRESKLGSAHQPGFPPSREDL